MMATLSFNELVHQRLVFHQITSIKLSEHEVFTAQKIKFSIKDFLSRFLYFLCSDLFTIEIKTMQP